MPFINKLILIAILSIISGFIHCTGKVNNKIANLLSAMTLEEKIGQMNQYSVRIDLTNPDQRDDKYEDRYQRLLKGGVGSVFNVVGTDNVCKLQKEVVEKTRLGIPLLFGLDVIHGYKTIFPIPLAESASWDLPAIRKSAAIAAKEAASAGIHWTFAPMVDISRDPRWGRIMEGGGEDPFLASLIAKERVEGFQGKVLSDIDTLAACAKHFAAYGFVEAGKEYNTVSIGFNLLHNVPMAPFKAAVESNVATLMNSFSTLDDLPASANDYLMTDLLRSEWGFKGFVVSDSRSIMQLVDHGIAADLTEASKLAIDAGNDMDMESNAYATSLKELVEKGLIDQARLEESVTRILQLKDDLGILDNPFLYCDASREKSTLLHPEHLEASRDMARKSIVLLKNEKRLLPLKKISKIALIGPLAKDKDAPLGTWRAEGVSNSAISLYEGLIETLPEGTTVLYAEGCKLSIGDNEMGLPVTLETKDRSEFAEAKRVASDADLVILAVGEPAFLNGEARSRTELGLPGLQAELVREIYTVNSNIVLVLINGRPLTIPWEAEHIPAIVEAWHLGSESGHAITDVLLGKYNPSGKLPITFPRNVGQIPIYYNHLNTGRPSGETIWHSRYIDSESNPQFPFGFGLSYTSFEYGSIRLTTIDGEIRVTVSITNTGAVQGEETVQLYIRDLVASISRPVKELKGFQKVNLAPGEGKEIVFLLTEKDLSFYKNGELIFEPGDFQIMVGGNSEDLVSAKTNL